MKKFLALFLALSCVMSITGCSEQDKKFVETLRPVQTNKNTSTTTLDLKFDYDDFDKIFDDIESYKIPADGEEYISKENEELEQSDIVDKEGNIQINVTANTKTDPINNGSDTNISLSLGSISLELGNIYSRGNDIYYSKEYLINSMTLGALLDTSNKDAMKQADQMKIDLNNNLKGKKYIKINSDEAENDLFNNYLLNAKKEKQIDDFLTIFKDFNSLVVTENENGVKFELNSDNYSAFITRTCEYLKARKDDYEQLFGIQKSEDKQSVDVFDSIIAAVNNNAFNNFMETAGLRFTVSDTVGKTDDTHYTSNIEGVFGKDGAEPLGKLTAKTEYTLTDNVILENIGDFVNYSDILSALPMPEEITIE